MFLLYKSRLQSVLSKMVLLFDLRYLHGTIALSMGAAVVTSENCSVHIVHIVVVTVRILFFCNMLYMLLGKVK